MNDVLKAEGLCKSFGTFKLKDVGLTLPEGYIMGLIGPNGAGKTTTISLILNQIRRDGGRVELFGEPVSEEDVSFREKIGFVNDSCYFCNDWTAVQAGKALSLFYPSWNGEGYAKYLREFGLPTDRKMKDFSKGMKMKLMIAGALSHETGLLILDEPTSGLDPVSRDELLDILAGYIADGKRSVLFSTHITADLGKAADYVTYLKEGEVFFTGEKQALLDGYVIARGGREELTSDLERKMSGLRVYGQGFEGLLSAGDRKNFPGLTYDPVTLDDIIVYTQRGEDKEMRI